VPIKYFFDDMSDGIMCSSPCWSSHNDSAGALTGDPTKDPVARRKTLGLVLTYYTIEKPPVRKRIVEVVKSIATTLGGE
jgi:hypothetical protein